MTDAPSAFTVPQYRGARAGRDYAQRAAERYRGSIRELWSRGVRQPGEIAAALNGTGLLSSTGQPWNAGSMRNTLRRLRFDRVADAQREADALEETLEELWNIGYRVPRQLARVLERLGISCPWGGAWSAGKADRLLQHHAGEWMHDSAGVRLRHGDDALKLDGFPELPALGRRRAAPPAPPAAVCEPREAGPRRRAVRI